MTLTTVLMFDANPDLREIWDYEKNSLNPEIISSNSSKKAWWLCKNNHPSYTTIQSRVKGKKCAICRGNKVDVGVNDLATLRPDLVSQMVNPLLASTLMLKSNKKIDWICSLGHQWKAYVYNRTNGDECPYCAGQKVLTGFNDLATFNPELAKEMDDPNLKATEVSQFSNKKALWKCIQGHQWKDTVSHRSAGRKCPICSNNKILKGYNDLNTTHPQIAKELKNFEQSYLVSAGSEKKLIWLCQIGHEWQEQVYRRTTRNFRCPYCSGAKVLKGFNDLATTHPKLIVEWHDTEIKVDEVSAGSAKKVKWKCTKGHTWIAIISNRARGAGCSQCSQHQTSKIENRLRDLLSKEFEGVGENHLNRVPVKGYCRKTRSIDIDWINAAGNHFIVEYDGSFWHNDKANYDVEKTENLLENGYIVIRIRESSRLYHLDFLDLEHPNLLQISVPYHTSDNKELLKAVEQIKYWISNRNN